MDFMEFTFLCKQTASPNFLGESGAIVAHPGDECNASRRLLKKENFLQKIVDFPQDRDYNFSENVDFPGFFSAGSVVSFTTFTTIKDELHPFQILVLFDMLSSLTNDCFHMFICERIKDRLAFSAALHQSALLQDLQLM